MLLLGTFGTGKTTELFIIDGLDRVDDLERAEALLVKSEMIARLDCPVVVSGPFVLRNHMTTARAERFSDKLTLANAPVLDPADPRKYGKGVDFLCEVYRKRVVDLHAEDLVDAPDLKKLAYYSGGRLRDFVRTLRMLARAGWTTDAPRATGEMVDGVIDKARRLMETGLDSGHIQVLEDIVRDPNHRLPPGALRTGGLPDHPEGILARDLLNYGRLLPYSNGSEWFYPHPLLTIKQVLVDPPGSAS